MLTADVIVIGGGIAGAAAAAEIAAGASVLLLEREAQPGEHATGRSAAILSDGYGGAVIRTATARSRVLVEALDPEIWAGRVLSPRGELQLARPGEEGLLVGAQLPVADALAMVPVLRPGAFVAAAYDPAAADIDVDLLLQGWLRLLRRRGGRVLTQAEATVIRREDGIWRVETPQGAAEAPVLVNAAGAWADVVAERAGMRPLGLRPLRRSAAILPAPRPGAAGWPLFGAAGDGWYARPMGGRLMVSPGEEDPVPPQDVAVDDMALAEGLARYEAMVSVPVTRVERSWAGLRSFLADRDPAVGFAEPGFFWLAGQGGYGVQTAAALAELAADLVLGRQPALPALVAALSPARLPGECRGGAVSMGAGRGPAGDGASGGEG